MLCTFMFVVFTAAALIYDSVREIDPYVGPLASWIFGVLLVIVLLVIPVSRYTISVGINDFESRKTTIMQQRDSTNSDYERVTLTEEIVNQNAWVVRMQSHKAGLVFNWFVPAAIEDVDPIK